ncbi:MAG TPA: hypothetical protein VEC39_18140 [Vicinamibacterales bacterium]|nr:hypothetical protein [Vicinamibacterales bacterium]
MRLTQFVVCIALAAPQLVDGRQRPVTSYDINTLSMIAVNDNIRIKKVMGEIGTFMIGDFTAGWKSTPHHHTHDQINVGISGRFNIVTPPAPYVVARLRGLLIPPDVQHGNDVTGEPVNPVLIEFQPVRRVDFPPEREKVSFPRAASPNPPAEDLTLDFTRDSRAWERLPNGARANTRKGTAAAVTAWELPGSSSEAIELRRALVASEQFVYVFDGEGEAMSGGDRLAAAGGTLLVGAAGAPAIRMRARGAAPVVVLVFEATKPQ